MKVMHNNDIDYPPAIIAGGLGKSISIMHIKRIQHAWLYCQCMYVVADETVEDNDDFQIYWFGQYQRSVCVYVWIPSIFRTEERTAPLCNVGQLLDWRPPTLRCRLRWARLY